MTSHLSLDLVDDKEAAVRLLTVTPLSRHTSHVTRHTSLLTRHTQADYSWFEDQGYGALVVRMLRSKSGGGQQMQWFNEQVVFSAQTSNFIMRINRLLLVPN